MDIERPSDPMLFVYSGCLIVPTFEHLEALKATRQFYTEPDPAPALGWHVLAVYQDCPAGCVGGEQLSGGELVRCRTCRPSGGQVPVGVGGVEVTHVAPTTWGTPEDDEWDGLVCRVGYIVWTPTLSS